MRSRTLSAVLLVVAVVMESTVLIAPITPWERLFFGLCLLALIIYLSSFLELTGLFGEAPPIPRKRRRFRQLRASTVALLAEVSRLNWLVVDLERGYGAQDPTQADIEASEKRLQDLLEEVLQNAGKFDPGFDETSDIPPMDVPGAPGRERRRRERRQSTRRKGDRSEPGRS